MIKYFIGFYLEIEMSSNKLTISEETTVAQNDLLESKNSKVAQVNSEASSSSDSASVKPKSKNLLTIIGNIVKRKTLKGSKQLDCGDEISSRSFKCGTLKNLNGSGENCSKSITKDVLDHENALTNQVSNLSLSSEKNQKKSKNACENLENLNTKDNEQLAVDKCNELEENDINSSNEATGKMDVLPPESRKRQQESSTEDDSDSEDSKSEADKVKESDNNFNPNLQESISIPCDGKTMIANVQRNSLFSCIMMIPIDCKGRIIGEKGAKIKEISQSCKARIHVDMEYIYYPWKEFRVNISGNPIQCKMAMSKILELIRQVSFHQQYPLKIYVESSYMAGIIGKKGQFLQQVKHVSGADFVKVFSTWPDKEKNGVLVIKHNSIYNCIKAAGMALNKLRTMQIFQIDNSRAKCKISLPDQKVSSVIGYEGVNVKIAKQYGVFMSVDGKRGSGDQWLTLKTTKLGMSKAILHVLNSSLRNLTKLRIKLVYTDLSQLSEQDDNRSIKYDGAKSFNSEKMLEGNREEVIREIKKIFPPY